MRLLPNGRIRLEPISVHAHVIGPVVEDRALVYFGTFLIDQGYKHVGSIRKEHSWTTPPLVQDLPRP